jgi:hypothetical protein
MSSEHDISTSTPVVLALLVICRREHCERHTHTARTHTMLVTGPPCRWFGAIVPARTESRPQDRLPVSGVPAGASGWHGELGVASEANACGRGSGGVGVFDRDALGAHLVNRGRGIPGPSRMPPASQNSVKTRGSSARCCANRDLGIFGPDQVVRRTVAAGHSFMRIQIVKFTLTVPPAGYDPSR